MAGTTFGTENGLANGTIPVVTPTYADQLHSNDASAGPYSGDGQQYVYVRVPPNVYLKDVSFIRCLQPDLIPENILSGKSIFGQAGTAVDGAGMKKFASGNVSVSGGTYGTVVISGLDFTPAFIAVCKNGGDEISFYNSGTLNQRLRRNYAPETNAIFNISAGSFSFSAYNEYTSGYYWFATN